jgi:large subunit ribosomal protein L19
MKKEVIDFNKKQREDKKMDYQAGDVVKVHLRIKEGQKERVQIFEGLVIAVKGRQSSSPKITVRKVTHGVGVEMIVPVLSKNVEKIELLKKAKVRRAKLYYVRDLTAKQSRMKYKDIKEYTQSNTEKTQNDTEVVAEEIKEEKSAEVVEEKK